MTTFEEPVLPISQGDWVAYSNGINSTLGRVRSAYFSDGKVFMDVVLYDFDGRRIGRESPAMGGPRGFEPALEFDDGWQRVEVPRFPIERRMIRQAAPDDRGFAPVVATYFADQGHSDGLKTKAIRTKNIKKRISSSIPAYFLPKQPTNGSEVEVAALRRSAQELRDMARSTVIDQAAKELLHSRAKALEAEASAIS